MKNLDVTSIRSIIDTKVKGVWIPCHDEHGHHYKHRDSGVVVDSITTKIILEKEHLVPWAAEIAVRHFIKNVEFYDPKNEEQTERMIEDAKFAFRATRDDAGNVGTLSHDVYEEYIENWIKDGTRISDIRHMLSPNADPRIYATVRSAEVFFNDHPEIIPVASELIVGDEKWGVAGSLDFLVIWNGKLWLLDFKTSNRYDNDEYAMQVVGYKKLFEKMTGLKIAGTSILGVSKGYDKYSLLDVLEPNKAFSAYRGVTKAYDWKYNGRDKLLVRKNRMKI